MKKFNIIFVLIFFGICNNFMNGSNLGAIKLSSLSQSEKNQELTQAARFGSLSEVKNLLLAGADVNSPSRQRSLAHRGMTSLMFAADRGSLDIVQCLLQEKSLNLEAVDSEGYTALMVAIDGVNSCGYSIESGRSAAAMAILKAGAKTNTINKSQDTPLILSAGKRNLTVLEELLRLGADVNYVGKNGNSAIKSACWPFFVFDQNFKQDKHQLSIAKKLLRAGADITIEQVGLKALASSSVSPEIKRLICAYSQLPDVASAQPYDREPEIKDYLDDCLDDHGGHLSADILGATEDHESMIKDLRNMYQSYEADLLAYWYPLIKEAHSVFIKDKNPNALVALVIGISKENQHFLERVIGQVFKSRNNFITLLSELAIKADGADKKEALEDMIISQAYKGFVFENQTDWLTYLIERFWTRSNYLSDNEKILHLKNVYKSQNFKVVDFLGSLKELEKNQRDSSGEESKILKVIIKKVDATRCGSKL